MVRLTYAGLMLAAGIIPELVEKAETALKAKSIEHVSIAKYVENLQLVDELDKGDYVYDKETEKFYMATADFVYNSNTPNRDPS